MIEDDLGERLSSAADEHDGEIGDLLEAAAGRLYDQQYHISELKRELEETNEGMVALTLELEEAEKRYRSLFENAVEGIYKTTQDGRQYVMANESMADILGYDSAASLQRAIEDVSEDVFVDEDRYEEYKSALLEGADVENFEYRVYKQNGEIRWVSDNAKVVYDDYGGPEGFRGGVIDITELKEYEDRLESRNEELEALNRVVRHDIANDMQIIRSWAEILEQRVDDENGERAVENILTTSDHIIDLTDEAREFVESVTGSEDPELKTVQIAEMLTSELERQRNAHEDATFDVVGEIPAVGVTANEMLSSVFRNLLGNAVQHNDAANSVIEISCRELDGTVEVRVADNGSGVPDDRKDEIFGKGEQSVDSDGTGIGLYLVNQLVTNYGGEVWVEDGEPTANSQGDSEGTTTDGAVFVVRLPKAENTDVKTGPF